MTINGITTILANTDGSAGRDKADVRPVPDLTHHLPADEWNAVKRAVVELTAAMGRATGEDNASLLAAIFGIPHGARTDRSMVASDFMERRGNERFSVTGSGAAALAAAAASSGASGVLALSHTGVAGTAEYAWDQTNSCLDGAQSPVLRLRFQTPSDLTASDVRMGLSDLSGLSYAQIGWDHTTMLRLYAKSVAGGSTASPADLFTLAASTWYEIEMRVGAGSSVAVYDAAGVNRGSISTAGTVLRAGDAVQPFRATMTRVGAAATLNVDWFSTLSGRR